MDEETINICFTDGSLRYYYKTLEEKRKKKRREYRRKRARELARLSRERRERERYRELCALFGEDNVPCPFNADETSCSVPANSDVTVTQNVNNLAVHDNSALHDVVHAPTLTENNIESDNEEGDITEINAENIDVESSDIDKMEESTALLCTLTEYIRNLACSTNMTTTQIDGMLAAFHNYIPHHYLGDLPKSYKTLCKATNSTVSNAVSIKSGHEYYYFGVEAQLKFYLGLYPESSIEKLDNLILTVNNDGLPIFKSNTMSSWPILVRIDNLRPHKIFPVTVTAGQGKPSSLDYIKEFTDEMKDLMRDGLHFRGRKFPIKVRAFVCDAPARAQLKCVKQFSSKYGCDHCESRGEHDGHRMTWPQTSGLPLRTNARFRTKADKDHHKDGLDSPLLQLDIDMIKCFPPDFMHQGSSGCMKKMLLWNVFGPKTGRTGRSRFQMSASNVAKLNLRMEQLREFIPSCFSRKPRAFTNFANFKATEFRQLQLYTGKIVFMDLMASEKQYELLVMYNCACALMIDESTAKTSYACTSILMQKVLDECRAVFGQGFLVYNVHAQLHFPEVARAHGSIDSVSAYPFESKLGQFKKMIRSSHRPIVSLIKGIQRQQAAECIADSLSSSPRVHTKVPNNIYINVAERRCFEVKQDNGDTVHCKEYIKVMSFFKKPIDSKKIGCLKVKSCWYKYTEIPAPYIIRECRRGMKIDLWKLEGMSVENKDTSVVMALLHDQEDNLY